MLSTLGPPEKYGMLFLKHLLSEHAALLVSREVWYETHPNKDKGSFKIYLQGPQYRKIDELTAAAYGMEALNCSIGHQMGG